MSSKDEATHLRNRLAYLRDLKAELQSNPYGVVATTVNAYTDLIDEIISDVALEVHRAVKTGEDNLSDLALREPVLQHPSLPPLPVVKTNSSVDVFGNKVEPIALEQVACPNCGRKVAAGRFAPHLEKCMQRGRQASRAANARFAQMDLS